MTYYKLADTNKDYLSNKIQLLKLIFKKYKKII